MLTIFKQIFIESTVMENMASACPTCGSERKLEPSGYIYCYSCSKDWYQNNKDKRRAYVKRNESKIKENAQFYRDHVLHPDYWVWTGMIQRCYNPKTDSYPRYGGRGIEVCDRWKNSFADFISDMGPRLDKSYSIERKDVDGHYEPNNCIWILKSQQGKNTHVSLARKSSISEDSPISYQNKVVTISEFSKLIDIPLTVVKYRYAQYAIAHWIIDSDTDGRYYNYKGKMYNLTELSLLSSVSYKTIHKRIRYGKWSVKDAVERL